MTIDKNFVHFNKLSDFELRLQSGDILNHSIVFIKDAKKIWTHGEYYSNLDDVLKITEQYLTEEQKAQVKANLGITKDVAIGDTAPSILPDLFVDTSRDYEDSLNSLIEDAPKDKNLYGRILGGWGIIKQDTLDTYTISSDGQIFNFTKNLEKGIVQYAEIYNPLETEVTIYIKRDTDTRKVEVKIAPGSTVLFRIISGIKWFYLEKVYYSYL